MKCPKCKSTNIVEWNTASVSLVVEGEEPDGTLKYGEWKVLTESIETSSGQEPYQCRACDHEFARPQHPVEGGSRAVGPMFPAEGSK